MSQRADFTEQPGYQAPGQYYSAVYQAYPGSSAGLPGPMFVQANVNESAATRHRLILAICSLVAVVISVIALVSALDTYSGSGVIFAALLTLALVCATIVAINIAFGLRR